MRINLIGAILPISLAYPVYPVRKKRKVKNALGKSEIDEIVANLKKSEEAESKVRKPSAPIHVETIPERLEKLRIQNYTIQYILMSESTVNHWLV